MQAHPEQQRELRHQQRLERFRHAAASFHHGRIRKCLTSPWRMAYPIALRWLPGGRVVRARAQTFWGDSMHVVLPEPASLAIYRYAFFEEDLTSVFLQVVKPGMTFFDIGAHFGYYSLLGSALVGESGRVHSFEPTPSTFEILRQNAAQRPNIQPNNVALYSREDEMVLLDYGVELSVYNSLAGSKLEAMGDSAPFKECRVKTITLDNYMNQTGTVPDFIKIDAENAELEILRGMEKGLALPRRPMITLEVNDANGEQDVSNRPVKYLLERGYTAFTYSAEARDIRPHAVQSSYYYDNILMVPKERSDALA
jgi:FkbM family methyltransferase